MRSVRHIEPSPTYIKEFGMRTVKIIRKIRLLYSVNGFRFSKLLKSVMDATGIEPMSPTVQTLGNIVHTGKSMLYRASSVITCRLMHAYTRT
jgi:hypothetical protein